MLENLVFFFLKMTTSRQLGVHQSEGRRRSVSRPETDIGNSVLLCDGRPAVIRSGNPGEILLLFGGLRGYIKMAS